METVQLPDCVTLERANRGYMGGPGTAIVTRSTAEVMAVA